ncbi:exopolyphosphatase, partial [bacterium]|nr:exopolyphosphatase [bacterium]
MKFAAIDIGSNAVRLLFARVFEDGKTPFFKKDSLFRVPLRLGDDVFTHRAISEEKASSLLEAMIAFKHLIQAYQPIDYMACATSAMREASNGTEMVNKIRKQAMIEVEIINGQREAEIIYSNHIAETLGKKNCYLYIDVGGGSTEITFIKKGKIMSSDSFNLGTVRMLEHRDSGTEWDHLKKWLKKKTAQNGTIMGIGSGGNINKIFELSRKKEGQPLKHKEIQRMYK